MLISLIPGVIVSALFGVSLLASTLVLAAVVRSGQIEQLEAQAAR